MVPVFLRAGLSPGNLTAAIRRLISESVRRLRKPPATPEDDAILGREVAASIRPVVRGYLAIAMAYYTFNGLFYRVPGDPGYVPGLAFLTVGVCFWLFRQTRGFPGMVRLEVAGHVTNALLLANTYIDIAIQYDAVKLVYFALLLPVFAISGSRLRVVLPSAAVSAWALCAIAYEHTPEKMTDYGWLAFTALVIALTMSGIMRMAILRAVGARITADRHRDEAHALAHFDALTGLPNRRHFFTDLEDVVRSGQAFDLGLVDLDGFKPVNDVYGHGTGDALLIEAGNRLSRVCEGRGTVARLGGDEFALILSGLASESELRTLGEDICESLRQPFQLGRVHAGISGSVGFVRCGRGSKIDGLNGSQLLERADYALYDAKQKQRGTPVIFDCRHEKDMLNFSRIEQALRIADLEAELSLMFQPQVDLATGSTVGFEALARWNSAQLGAVPPDLFIPAAERSGLISDITLCLLKKALSEAANWPEFLRISFNLSVRDLHSPRTISSICQTVWASGIAPARIEFEITETAMLKDFEQALEGLSILKSLGVRLALDDFGSGYSSFGYIHQLPVDKIKIDRSFVTQLLKNVSARKIIKTIVDLCDNLNLDHIVEGVETEEEVRLLRDVNVRCIQGYVFSPPMAIAALHAYLAEMASRPIVTPLLRTGS